MKQLAFKSTLLIISLVVVKLHAIPVDKDMPSQKPNTECRHVEINLANLQHCSGFAGTSGSWPRDIRVNRRAREERRRPLPCLLSTHRANVRRVGRESTTGWPAFSSGPSPLGDSSTDESSSGEEIAPFPSAAAATLGVGDPAASSPPASGGKRGESGARSASKFGPSGTTTASAIVVAALGAAV